MSTNTNQSHSSLFLTLLQPPCHQGQRGNMSVPSSTPRADASTEEGKEVEDTDFGAVLYITAVLIFYSLGIVVMIVKYLKTERKEMEEEQILDNFFKGIPSKKIEHEQEAVNRVAIRAFHTLTSGATWQDQLPIAMEPSQQMPENPDSIAYLEAQNEYSVSTDDSDSTKEDCSSRLLQRERSKYLPRVSLVFRQSRFNDQRKFQDSLRCNSSQSPQDTGLCEGQRWSHPSFNETENGQVDGCLDDSKKTNHTDDPTESQTDSSRIECGHSKQAALRNDYKRLQNKNTSRGAGVRFRDDEGVGRKNVSSGRERAKARSSSRTSEKGNVNKEHPIIPSLSDTIYTGDDTDKEIVNKEHPVIPSLSDTTHTGDDIDNECVNKKQPINPSLSDTSYTGDDVEKVNVNKEHPITSSLSDAHTNDEEVISETALSGQPSKHVDRDVSSTTALPDGVVSHTPQTMERDSEDVDPEPLVSPIRLLVSDV